MCSTRLAFISLFSFLFIMSSVICRKALAVTYLAQTEAPIVSVGTTQCSEITGDNTNSRPIQTATLESRNRGYTLKFTEIFQGQPQEVVWQLDENLFIEEARTAEAPWNLTSYNRSDPVEIQPTGEFSINMMVSSRSICTFSGTLEFLGNAQTRLFP